MTSTINLLRILADPTRLRLLLLLEQEELSVAELQEILSMGQSRISSHLAQLKRAGVVDDRRAGKNVYYGPAKRGDRSGALTRVNEMVRTLARELPDTARDRTALKLTLRKRQDKAREYFDELAGKFGRSHCPGRSWEALAHTLIFFFSSRRRHTRLQGDWSSDVCSSDLRRCSSVITTSARSTSCSG